MKTAIRLDDITPTMDMEKYGKIEKILDDAGIKPLIGVVPFNKDDNLNRSASGMTREEFVEYLAKRKDMGWEVALHGYNHLYTTSKMGIFPLNNFSEYAGVSYDRQLSMLVEGKKELELLGVKTDIFMTPAHTYDKNTLRALKNAGFTKVTDGFGELPYKRAELTFYPISKRRSDCVSDKNGYSTYVLHTNTMEDRDIENFAKTIRDHRECFIDYSEYLKVTAVTRGSLGNIKEYITALAKFITVKLMLLPSRRYD